jgi:hypothetical protein
VACNGKMSVQSFMKIINLFKSFRKDTEHAFDNFPVSWPAFIEGMRNTSEVKVKEILYLCFN